MSVAVDSAASSPRWAMRTAAPSSAVVDHQIARAFRGDRAARRALGERLLPVIRRAVARRLAPLARACRRDPSLDRDDFVHGVWVRLFDNDWRILRAFDPGRGSLEAYVATIADRHVLAVFRTKSKDPYGELPMLEAKLELCGGAIAGPEPQTAARSELERLHAFLHARLDARGLLLFHMLEVEGLTVPEVCARADEPRRAVPVAQAPARAHPSLATRARRARGRARGMNGEHHDDTQTETLLAALVEDLRARETDWSSYAEGQRSAEEVCASRRAAGDDEAEIEATLALYQPMDPGKRAALLEQLECWPERTGASPKRAPERKTAWLGAVLALAAAAVLMVVARPLLSPAPAPQVSALPSFVLSTDTGGAELRSASKPPGPLAAQPAPLRYRPAHRFDWRLRPAEPVEAVLELGICAQPEHGPVRLISADPFVETAPSGAMRLRGQIAALGLEPGAWRLTLIVRPRASLPFDAASCDVADSPAQRVAHLELRVE